MKISNIRNPLLRKTAIIMFLLLMPISLPCGIICIAIMEGVPNAWDAIIKIGKTGEIDTIKRAWIGTSK
jgi:hypothetical protein